MTGVWWIARSLFTHQMSRHLEQHKAELTKAIEQDKAELTKAIEQDKAVFAGEVRKEVESILAERTALVEYEWDARKRLYTAIRPLKFQLLMACRDDVAQIYSYPQRRYSTNTSGYYGRIILFTLMRPLVLSELIEQQVAYTDFGVDTSAIDLLRFKKASYSAFTGATVIPHRHLDVNHNQQVQHLFYGTLNAAANALVITENGGIRRCVMFHECVELVEQEKARPLDPIRAILDDFSIETHPLFWVRLVCFGFLCSRFIAAYGT